MEYFKSLMGLSLLIHNLIYFILKMFSYIIMNIHLLTSYIWNGAIALLAVACGLNGTTEASRNMFEVLYVNSAMLRRPTNC